MFEIEKFQDEKQQKDESNRFECMYSNRDSKQDVAKRKNAFEKPFET